MGVKFISIFHQVAMVSLFASEPFLPKRVLIYIFLNIICLLCINAAKQTKALFE